MKIRNGFVSNSSSSSFIVLKKNLLPKDLRIIEGMIAKEKSEWEFHEKDDRIIGYTIIDNYQLKEKLQNKNVDIYAMAWMERPGWAWREIFLGEEVDIEATRKGWAEIEKAIKKNKKKHRKQERKNK